MGYLNRENDTKEVMTEDHWLKMGDTAIWDEEGFLVLTGNPRDFITLSTGDLVNPTIIEDRVRMELPCVSNCLVVGDDQPYLGLLITLDTIMDTEQGLPTHQLTLATQKWFKTARFDVKTVSDVIKNKEAGIKHVIQVGQKINSEYLSKLNPANFRRVSTEPIKRLKKRVISLLNGIL